MSPSVHELVKAAVAALYQAVAELLLVRLDARPVVDAVEPSPLVWLYEVFGKTVPYEVAKDRRTVVCRPVVVYADTVDECLTRAVELVLPFEREEAVQGLHMLDGAVAEPTVAHQWVGAH